MENQKTCWYLRLKRVADSHADEDGVADLFPDAGGLVKRGHESQADRPAHPAKEDTLSISTNPVDDKPREGAAEGLH